MGADGKKEINEVSQITGTQKIADHERTQAYQYNYRDKCVLNSKKSGALDFIKDGFCFYKDVVIDSRTGLMWTRNADIAGKRMTWDEAIKWVEGSFFSSRLKYAEYHDWRLPSVEELYVFSSAGEGKNVAAYFNELGFYIADQPSMYWTSTTAGADAYLGPIPINRGDWYVSLYDGHAGTAVHLSNYYVWPVRTSK